MSDVTPFTDAVIVENENRHMLLSRREMILACGALLVIPLRAHAVEAIDINMDWRWGQGHENVESQASFDALVQYLWGQRGWGDVFVTALGVVAGVVAGQPQLLFDAVASQGTDPDPNGAFESLRDGHGSDTGAKSTYDRLWSAGHDQFFRRYVMAATAGPDWNATDTNLRWHCENNPISAVTASRVWAAGHTFDRQVTNAMYWLHCGQFHNDGARQTYRRAGAANIERLFRNLDDRIRETDAERRAAELAVQRTERAQREGHPVPGHPDSDRF